MSSPGDRLGGGVFNRKGGVEEGTERRESDSGTNVHGAVTALKNAVPKQT